MPGVWAKTDSITPGATMRVNSDYGLGLEV